MVIKTALDWPKISIGFQASIGGLKSYDHRHDANIILANITTMVTELSKLDLVMRTTPGHNPTKVNAQLKKINDEINNLDQWITMLMLY